MDVFDYGIIVLLLLQDIRLIVFIVKVLGELLVLVLVLVLVLINKVFKILININIPLSLPSVSTPTREVSSSLVPLTVNYLP